MRCLRAILIAWILVGAPVAQAVQPDEMLSDPALEARARNLSRELRCMVCQNQSIDDSDAPLARDLRLLVRERLKAGDTDDKVLEFLTARYGQFVLLKPRLSYETALLWFGPAAVLAAGVTALIVLMRRRRRRGIALGESADAGLTPAERARLAQLVGPAEK
jgi:cytochrome c-type biogenesis protein CcmH